MSTLSICTICQDEEDVIPLFLSCCKYIYQQLGDDLKEVIVVDGGSKDRTKEILVSYLNQIPLVILDRPFDNFGQQKNHALESAEGDFILGLDTDMTISKNFTDLFKANYFNSGSYWDLMMIFTGRDAYHYYHTWGINPNMRLWKRGPKFVTNFHEKLQGQVGNTKTCSAVYVFENSIRASDDALKNRGLRYQKFTKEMEAEGRGPGHPDRYISAKYCEEKDLALLPDHIRELVIEGT